MNGAQQALVKVSFFGTIATARPMRPHPSPVFRLNKMKGMNEQKWKSISSVF
jgi:hypothetical protein